MGRWDTAALLTRARTLAQAPVSSTSAPGYQDADLLELANQALELLASQVAAVRKGFFNVVKTTAFTAGTATYRLPTRAMGGGAGVVKMLTASNTEVPLRKTPESEWVNYDKALTGTPSRYVWRSNSITFWPIPDSASYSYVLVYRRRPGKLVGSTTSTVGIVSSVAAPSLTLTATKPTTFTTSTPLDFIRGSPPFDPLGDDATPTVASGSGLTFGAGIVPSELAAGDYVALAGETPVVPLPDEGFSVLALDLAINLTKRREIRAELVRQRQDAYFTLLAAIADRDADVPDRLDLAGDLYP